VRCRRALLAVLLALALSSTGEAARRPPDVYPLLFQTMPGRLEPSDFPKLARYDIIELNTYATDTANRNLDSLRAIRARNPDLIVLVNLSGSITCSNWGSREFHNRDAWADAVAAHADTWLLRDTDGDLYLMNDLDTLCEGGRLNYYSLDMARAFARFLAEATVLRFPNDIDGIRIDDIVDNIYYMNKWASSRAPGVDSIDVNQDGIADTSEELGIWWSAGVDTFLATLRGLIGPEKVLTVNGYIPLEAYRWVNGRFHEGYPHEHGDGWWVGMTHRKRGFLGGDTLYSNTPFRLSGLPTFNASDGYDFDPNHLSTKEAPFPHPGFPGFLRFTLASCLLGEGYYGMTGWGTAVDWKGDPVPYLYQTLWWFPVYDTLRTYLGTPVEKAVRDTDPYGRERWRRTFTGGRTRVFPTLRRGILDLRPIPSFTAGIPAVVHAGTTVPVRVGSFDPNGSAEALDLELRLSRDGGLTFPEIIATGGIRDSVFEWTADGPAESCLFRLAATDTSGLTGTALSVPFRIEAPPASGGLAEIRPDAWIAHSPSVLCTLSVWTPDEGIPAAGWDRIAVALPEGVHLLSFAGAERNGVPIAASALEASDTLRIALGTPAVPPARVRARFFVNAPAPSDGDSLRFAVLVGGSESGAPLVLLVAGDANGNPNDANALAVTCAFGPPARLAVEPEEVALAAGDTARFVLSGYDAAGNALDLDPVWTASDTLGTIDASGLFLAIRPGSLEVVGSVGDLDVVARVSIVPGPPDSIQVVPESLSVTTDDTVGYIALVWDHLLNVIQDAPVAWFLEDTLGTIDAAGRLVPKRPGTTSVRAKSGDAVGRSLLRVETGAPDSVRASPRPSWIAVGDTVRFRAEILDRWKNAIAMAPVWTVTDSLGVIDSTGLFRATGVGIGWAIARAGSAADSVVLDCAPAPPIAFLIDPRDPIATVDSLLSFTLFGISAFADTFPILAEWAVRGDAGTIENGVFVPRRAGSAVVVGSCAEGSDSTSITILPGAPVLLRIEPDSASVAAGETLQVRAALLDRNGDLAEGRPALRAEGPCEGAIDSFFVCERVGSGWIQGSFGSLRDSIPLRVRAAEARSLVVAPRSVAAPVGSTVLFTAEAADAYGNAVDSLVVWESAGGIGSIDAAGLFTALAPGSGLVVARSGTLADTAQVAVHEPIGGPDPEEPPACSLVVRAVEESYDASLWPAPIAFLGLLLDDKGNPVDPGATDSFTVHLRLLEETAVSCDASHAFPLAGDLRDMIRVPVDRIGGCGLLDVRMEGPGGLLSAPDTILFSSPDANADLRVDLEDVGALVAAWGTAGGFSCLDLDGDGLAGAGDLAVAAGSYDRGCREPEPLGSLGSDGPAWYALGDASLSCAGETLAARFRLDAGTLDSIRALEVSFPARGQWARPIVWIPSSAWRAPLVLTLSDGPDGPRILIVETDGAAVPRGDGLLEARVCGAATDAFGGGSSYARIVKGDGETTPAFEAPIRFLLDLEEEEDEEEIADTTSGAAPSAYAVLPNLPNPFRGSTTIRFAVPNPGGPIRLEIFNVQGERVRVLEEGTADAGTHALEWNGTCARGRSLPPGVYFVRLEAPPAITVKKLLLLP